MVKSPVGKDATKTKIIFIGDYKNSETVQLLLRFVEKYSGYYDICITGYNFIYIMDLAEACSNVSLCGMNDRQHIYDKYTAEYVVIATPAPHYMRVKRTQKIIYIISEFDEKTFAGCASEIAQIVTDSNEAYDFLSKTFPHIRMAQFKGATVQERAQSAVDNLMIREGCCTDRKRYLLVTNKRDYEITKDRNGVGRYLKRTADISSNDVIALSIDGGASCLSGSVAFGNVFATRSILELFDGTIIFDSEIMRSYFVQYLLDNEITLRAENRIDLPELKLMDLAEAADEVELLNDEDISDHQKYLRILDKLYREKDYNRFKVSVIITRYNTSVDLLARAIESALNCGHRNVEVLVVDDGSDASAEAEVRERFKDDRLIYCYKDHENVGAARNYGIRRATGEYILFLDSDDAMHPDGMARMVAHASYYGLEMVMARRILCDENGVPYSESYAGLSGNTFLCYYSGFGYGEIYSDSMMTNRLIRRSALMQKDIRFVQGIYEDLEFATHMHSAFSEYHYLSVVIYDWYQYRDRKTISSSIDELANMKERVAKENLAWMHVPERIRRSRIKTILQVNFNRYFAKYFEFSDAERSEIRNLLKDFIRDKRQYIDRNGYPEATKELVASLEDDSQRYFEYVIKRFYGASDNGEEPYDNYVIFTHYHLYVACLYALKNKRKARVFVCQSYVAFDTNLIYRIKKTGLFESVIPFTWGNIVASMFKELDERPGEEAIIIPNYLYGRFAGIFRNCNTKNDDFYIFSDSHPYWYYLERECENIIKLEDAYNSFDREIKTLQIQGMWAGIQKYEGTLFPEMWFRSSKIKKIIVSSETEGLPDEYASRIEILDTKLLEREYYDEIKSALLSIYSVDASYFTEDATLLLTQPLALFGYCSLEEQEKLMKRMVSPYSGSKLLIKPHPADTMNYEFLNGTILPKSIPIEVYNFMDVKIARAITFGSSAIETIEFARDKKAYFRLHDFDSDDVKAAIKKMIENEKNVKTLGSVTKKMRKAAKKLFC